MMTIDRVDEIFENAKNNVIAVVGDVMLDRYFWGSVSRVSPEAPVPVIDISEEKYHLGGAANVANNLHSLGVSPLLCGAVGGDKSGEIFTEISRKSGIDCSGLFTDKLRPTTVKTRIMGNNQHIARLDREIRDNLTEEGEDFIMKSIENQINLSGIIFQDYNKGVISERLINRVMNFAVANKVPAMVDPKFDNFFAYRKTTLFKPNRKEAARALGHEFQGLDEIKKAGTKLLKKLECENVLLTLGSEGMMLFQKSGDILSVPTHARHIADVSGAGDTAIATLSAAVAGGASIREAAVLSNHAAGAVCEMPGIVSITLDNLKKSVLINN
jgi:D-glycero-beta-D-manno-heptose-7-phosphate kinase